MDGRVATTKLQDGLRQTSSEDGDPEAYAQNTCLASHRKPHNPFRCFRAVQEQMRLLLQQLACRRQMKTSGTVKEQRTPEAFL